MNHLLSSPKPPEKYIIHIERVKEQFKIIYPIFKETLSRLFSLDNIQDALYKMVIFHDLGKLTEKWQKIAEREIKENKNIHKPAHAPIGAAYLYKILPKGLKEPISFAVAIHHSDRGMLGDNIEKPDVQAINDGIIDYSTNKIVWDTRGKELGDEYFPEEVNNLGLADLKRMARNLRFWAKGCNLLEQHTRRMQMSLVHHILKLCDISASSEREEYRKKPDNPFGGWLMAEKIKNYVENISVRKRTIDLQNELTRCVNTLKRNYKPEKIILFGSLATGKISNWSDIDLVVIKDTNKPFLDRIKEILMFIHPKVGMDILVYTSQEFKELSNRKFFTEEILSKGEIIYERGS